MATLEWLRRDEKWRLARERVVNCMASGFEAMQQVLCQPPFRRCAYLFAARSSNPGRVSQLRLGCQGWVSAFEPASLRALNEHRLAFTSLAKSASGHARGPARRPSRHHRSSRESGSRRTGAVLAGERRQAIVAEAPVSMEGCLLGASAPTRRSSPPGLRSAPALRTRCPAGGRSRRVLRLHLIESRAHRVSFRQTDRGRRRARRVHQAHSRGNPAHDDGTETGPRVDLPAHQPLGGLAWVRVQAAFRSERRESSTCIASACRARSGSQSRAARRAAARSSTARRAAGSGARARSIARTSGAGTHGGNGRCPAR